MATVLITQCLQRDFVDPIGPHDPLPNLLHVGYSEAARLLGPEPATGPLAQLIQWARGLPADAIDLVHIRDWHDPNDPAQREHLEHFGAHCIAGTVGARLVLEMDEGAEARPNECIVDSITLNDLARTNLEAQLERIRREHGGEPLRVAVIGVWTEAKVSFLLYELSTRLGIEELATCSALTASASRTQHFNALSQLNKILGVSCFDSLAEFVDWLQPGAELELPRHQLGFEPRISGSETSALQDADRTIVAHLFRDSTEVELEALHGGYSDATVWQAVSRDALGQQHAPAVVKLGPNRTIAQERVAFEQVEDVLGNSAPRVRDFVDLADRAGLKYSYAAMGQGGVRTVQSLFAADVPTPQLASIVHTTFDEILGPLYAAASYERLPLFSHYEFSADKAPHVRAAVAALVPDATEPMLAFPGGLELPNVSGFYEEFLAHTPLPTQDYHYVSYVHGDLNAANILVDAHDNVWVIDFFHAGRAHVLKDLAKFENDLLYILTPIDDDAQLREAISITLALREVADLRAALGDPPTRVQSPHLLRAWEILKVLRKTISNVCHDDRNPLQYHVAALRYAVHTLSFPEPSPLQKQSALVAACSLADQVATTVKSNLVLRVDWIDSPQLQPGRLGMTICPGRRDRDRNLEADLTQLRSDGVDRLLSLSSEAELEWAGVSDLGSRAETFGFDYRSFPVPDQGTCSLSEADDLVRWCRDGLDRGESVVLTCMGGLGRSGMIAACTLVDLGAAPATAIAFVRAARGPRALETSGQEELVSRFAKR